MRLRALAIAAAVLLALPALVRADGNLPERYRGPGIAVRGPGAGEAAAPAGPGGAAEDPDKEARAPAPGADSGILAECRVDDWIRGPAGVFEAG